MPSYKDAFPGRYLKSEDLQGRPCLVTIRAIDVEAVGQAERREQKLCARYEEMPEKLHVLNRTNSDTIAEIIGSEDIDAWIGESIVLFPTTTLYGGKKVACIRVRAPQKKAKAAGARPAPAVVPADEIAEAMPTIHDHFADDEAEA